MLLTSRSPNVTTEIVYDLLDPWRDDHRRNTKEKRKKKRKPNRNWKCWQICSKFEFHCWLNKSSAVSVLNLIDGNVKVDLEAKIDLLSRALVLKRETRGFRFQKWKTLFRKMSPRHSFLDLRVGSKCFPKSRLCLSSGFGETSDFSYFHSVNDDNQNGNSNKSSHISSI